MVREIWWKSGSARVVLAITGVVVTVGAVIWAVAVVGTPRMARMRELDRARVGELHKIQVAIEEFYAENGRLPGNLDELELKADDLKDPETGEQYGYVIEDARRYRISARFSLADDKGLYWYDGDWEHGSGVHEFSFMVPENDKRSESHIGLTTAPRPDLHGGPTEH